MENGDKKQEDGKQDSRRKREIIKLPAWIFQVIAIVVIVFVLGIVVVNFLNLKKAKSQPEIISTATLEKIIEKGDLYTFVAIYNGVAQVMDEKKPEKVSYYVSYKAEVKAGINFENIEIISVDNETKEVHIKIPEATILEVSVDMSSLDYIFQNQKANKSGVSAEAYKACEEDVKRESAQQDAILNMASENAQKVLIKMTEPIIKQLGGEYTLKVE